MKILKKILKILIALIVIIIITNIVINIFPKKLAVNAMSKYLKIKNVNKDDIYSLKIIYDYKRGGIYKIIIRYNNEKNLEYYYEYYIFKGTLEFSTIYLNRVSIKLYENEIKYFNEKYNSPHIVLKYNIIDYLKDLLINK